MKNDRRSQPESGGDRDFINHNTLPVAPAAEVPIDGHTGTRQFDQHVESVIAFVEFQPFFIRHRQNLGAARAASLYGAAGRGLIEQV